MRRILLATMAACSLFGFELAQGSFRAAVAAPEAARSIDDLKTRAEQGDPTAPSQLCQLFFEGRAAFEPTTVYRWCRRAADLGDGASVLRVGLLSLAGIGTSKDLGAAAKECAAAHSPKQPISAGFCLAAVAEEENRGAGLPRGSKPYPAADERASVSETPSAASVTKWREAAQRGDAAAAAQLCEFYFGSSGAAFETEQAAQWCRRASQFGNPEAMQRLGLLRLWGIGVEKTTPQAEALCQAAQARQDAVGSYCLAAIKQERAAVAAAAAPSHFTKPGGVSPAMDGSSPSNAFGYDRALASVHVTPTGLQFSCRDILRWARYETIEGLNILTPDVSVFGRSILDYRDADFSGLDQGAAKCASAVQPYDMQGVDRLQLAEFRKMLPLMKARQRELEAQLRVEQADVPRCLEALRSSWASQHYGMGMAAPERWTDGYACVRGGRQPKPGSDAPAPAKPPRSAEAR